MRTVFGVHVYGGLHQKLILFTDEEGDVYGLVGELFVGTVQRDPATLEIQITEGAGQALVKDRRQKIALELLCHHCALSGYGVERVSLFVGAALLNEVAVKHLMKRLGKVEVHNIVVLHDDVVDGYKIERIIDIPHQIQNEDLDVIHASDR